VIQIKRIAARACRKREPDVALLLVGGGPYRNHLNEYGRRPGVGANVRDHGSVPWQRAPDALQAGDVFAMHAEAPGGAWTRGMGIVYLEASATGLPVVAEPKNSGSHLGRACVLVS